MIPLGNRRSFVLVAPFLLAIYQPLFLFAQNLDKVSSEDLVVPLVVSGVIASVVYSLSYLLFRDAPRTVFFAILCLLLFSLYGHVLALLFSLLFSAWLEFDHGLIELHQLERTLGLALLAVWLLVVVAGIYYLRRGAGVERFQSNLARCNSFATFVVSVLLLQSLGQIFVSSPKDSVSPSVDGGVLALSPQETAKDAGPLDSGPLDSGPLDSGPLGYQPDIYFIVLDGYARADVLKEHYNFDNREFLDGLRQKGFFIAEKSRSNYTYTDLSLASTLNMKHLAYLEQELGPKATRRDVTYELVQDNEVVRFLKSRGYHYIHFRSTASVTAENSNADREIRCESGAFSGEFSRVFAESTLLRFWMSSRTSVDLAECHLSQLARLSDIASERGPKFVFAHFIPPHHPYLFGRDGTILRRTTIANQFKMRESQWQDTKAYVDQLYFFSKKVDEAIGKIIRQSERPPIIILKSDHGPKLFYYRPYESIEKRKLYSHVRMATLGAYFLPEPQVQLPADSNSVNDFVYVLNHYLGASYKLQPNTQFYSYYYAPFDFSEVELPD